VSVTINNKASQDVDLAEAPQIEGFDIVAIAGRGGMSIVYKARQAALGRIVAVKMLQTRLSADSTAISRFMQEARMTTSLHHPNIAGVISFGTTESHQLFLVLDYLEGNSLKEEIAEKGALPAETFRELFVAILEGLQAAHDKGIVHRDLKPANVVLVQGEDGVTIPKLVDFGIAKIFEVKGGEAQRLTQTGAIVGSPAYMSPEQCNGGTVDARSDLYSVGCMMFEALTGRPVFDSDNLMELMTSHLMRDPTAPSMVSRCANGFDEVILKCLNKDPAERFQNCGEVIAALKTVEAMAPDMVAAKRKRRGRQSKKIEKLFRRCVHASIACLLLGLAYCGYMQWQAKLLDAIRQQKLNQVSNLIDTKKYVAAFDVLKTISLKNMPPSQSGRAVYYEYTLADELTKNFDDEKARHLADTILDDLKVQLRFCANAAHGKAITEVRRSINSRGTDTVSFKHFLDNRPEMLQQIIGDINGDSAAIDRPTLLALAYYELGESYRQQQNYQEAESAYSEAAEYARVAELPDLQRKLQSARARTHAVQK
jgi:serine/threonine protein kinase